jgi:hypothetical protein
MMSDSPSFLPPILNLDGEWPAILDRLYAVFVRDFKETRTQHKGLRVIYNGAVMPDGLGKEEGFWHVVGRKDKDTGERLLDYPRAKRLPWAKPVMESPERPEIKVWQYKEGPSDSGIRTYLWLEKYDYLLILHKKKNVYYWVTAFYVDYEGKRAELRRKYAQRL